MVVGVDKLPTAGARVVVEDLGTGTLFLITRMVVQFVGAEITGRMSVQTVVLLRIEEEEDLLREEVVDLPGDMVELHRMGLSTVTS